MSWSLRLSTATPHASRKQLIVLAVVVFVIVTMWLFFSQRKPSELRCARGVGEACAPVSPAFRDRTKSPAERADNLLSYMTLDEKVGQLALVEKNSVHSMEDITRYGLGALLSGAGGKPETNTAAGWRAMVDAFQGASRNSRLGIPLLYGIDANHGHANVPGATVFPHQIGLGATGDPALVERIAEATAKELVATHIYWNFMPSLDAPQDIRWGRVYEAFGSDVSRIEQLGSAYVQGLQSDREAPRVIGTAKHYLAAGSMQWGTSSNSKFSIDQGQTPPDERALREAYLPPFRAAVEAGVGSVMVGLNRWGNHHVASNHTLLTDILKRELGFSGFVVSDWYGVYEIPGGSYRATIKAINAGVDMVMLPYDYKPFIEDVMRAVSRGEISQQRLDDAVRRILIAKFALGLFDERRDESVSVVGAPEHRALAREAVARSQVLLKNDGVLPLSTSVKSIAVVGSASDNIGRQVGAWTVEWQGIDGNWLPGATSVLQGIREAAPKATIMHDVEGNFAPDAQADIGIAIVGESPYAEGWGDNERPELSPQDYEAISRLRRHANRVIVLIISGRPLLISAELARWDALVAGWLPGSEGSGVADTLFGKSPFVGTLPVPWPASAAGIVDKEISPLFPLGFRAQ